MPGCVTLSESGVLDADDWFHSVLGQRQDRADGDDMTQVPGVILAGGQSRRMGGGDKTLLPLGGLPIIAHVIRVLGKQTCALLINSNSDPVLFENTGLAVRSDVLPGRLGPLAGIHTAMLWARENGADAVLTVPADTPFLPEDLVARLAAARLRDQAAIAASQGRPHPVIGLWPCARAEQLREYIEGGNFRVSAWLERIPFTHVDFEGEGLDPFWNINTPDDLRRARLMRG